MYQAFSIALFNRHLYTDLIHYFGPVAPYINAYFLKVFGVSITNFSFIGFFITTFAAVFIYRIGNFVLEKNLSLLSSLLFISTAAINYGGGSFFMPYSYAHAYGILFSLIALEQLLSYLNDKKKPHLIVFLIFSNILLFTKQEYLFVFITLIILVIFIEFKQNRSSFFKSLLLYGSLSIIQIGLIYTLSFRDFSVLDLWEQSSSMFSEHNSGIFHNFLMLYSPGTLKNAFYSSIPLVGIISILIFTTKLKKLNSIQITVTLLSSFISILLIYLFHENIYQEWEQRSFFLNWLTLTSIWFLIIFKRHTLNDYSFLLPILLVSFSLYNRQQTSSWMWQGLNWIVFIYLLNQLKQRFSLPFNLSIFGYLLMIVLIGFIPFKLNQSIQAEPVFNKSGEKIMVKPAWKTPIQETITFIDSLPQGKTLYCGQETGWLNVLTGRYNQVRNQQWWGYMKNEIIEDVIKTKPDYLVITFYPKSDGFRFYGGGNQLFSAISPFYHEIKLFQNEAIKIQILELNENRSSIN